MSFISDLFRSLTGGVDTSEQDITLQTNRERQAFIQQQGELAAADLNRLFEPSLGALTTGAQSAIDFLQDSEARRISPLQEGSRRAQETQLAGLDQIQNAILGQPVDFSQLRASNISVPPQTPVTVPDFTASMLGGQDLFDVSQQPSALPGQLDISGLVPHKDHFHTADGRKVSASEILGGRGSFGPQVMGSVLGGDQFGLEELNLRNRFGEFA